MEIERSLEPLTENDLKELYVGSVKRLNEYFIDKARKQMERALQY